MRILPVRRTGWTRLVYLIDTNVISELRKHERANPGVLRFFQQAIEQNDKLYLSVITVGELRRGVELIHHRGDLQQAELLENWLVQLLRDFGAHLLDINADVAQLWGRLRVPHPENALDKLIAATALIYDLTLVTRNERDFDVPGLSVLNPFL
jgi:predicted nucleic acid-binding protein